MLKSNSIKMPEFHTNLKLLFYYIISFNYYKPHSCCSTVAKNRFIFVVNCMAA